MMLYQIDLSAATVDKAMERFWATYASGEALDPPPPYFVDAPRAEELQPPDEEVRAYAEALVRGVVAMRDELDERIQKVSLHWRLDRMACVDRNLLRLGAYELTERGEDVPRKVVINEAVEIAKRFGTAESSAFINGVLDRVAK